MSQERGAPQTAKASPPEESRLDFLAVFLCGVTFLFIALALFLS